jgi:hypothetical protein
MLCSVGNNCPKMITFSINDFDPMISVDTFHAVLKWNFIVVTDLLHRMEGRAPLYLEWIGGTRQQPENTEHI